MNLRPKHRSRSALALCLVAAMTMAACSSSGKAKSGKPAAEKLADGKTLTIAMPNDPGNVDPGRSVDRVHTLLARFTYDTPITVDKNNKVQPGIVSSWTTTGNDYTLTIKKGVTCADGSPMDAKTVADNINYVGNTKNSSPYTGVAAPAGTVATPDNAAGTVSVKLPSPTPFFIQNLVYLFLVCEPGLANRKLLAKASVGSGPFVISGVVPGQSVSLTVRRGYTWGPLGASTSAKGTPAKVVFKVVSNETTLANLLMSGAVNIGGVQGPDRARLKAAGLAETGLLALSNEMFFNQTSGQPTSDVRVRQALVAALDLDQLAKVDTSGHGDRATGLMAAPKICPGNTINGFLPDYDVAKARTLLDEAGWKTGAGGVRTKNGAKLTVSVQYASGSSTGTAVAEFIAAAWQKVGVQAPLHQKTGDQVVSTILGGAGTWDSTLTTIAATNPATFVPFLSGAVPPKGTDFGHIDNARYNALIASASRKAGTSGCADWNAGESALFKDADVLPISEDVALIWANGATFGGQGDIVPTAVKMLAK